MGVAAGEIDRTGESDGNAPHFRPLSLAVVYLDAGDGGGNRGSGRQIHVVAVTGAITDQEGRAAGGNLAAFRNPALPVLVNVPEIAVVPVLSMTSNEVLAAGEKLLVTLMGPLSATLPSTLSWEYWLPTAVPANVISRGPARLTLPMTVKIPGDGDPGLTATVPVLVTLPSIVPLPSRTPPLS